MTLKTINKTSLQDLISKDEKYVLIDVRNPDELIGDMPLIPTAKNVPMNDISSAVGLEANQFNEKYGFDKPNKDDRVIVYCRSGRRSDAVQKELIRLGYSDVTNYTGSALDWYNKQ